MCCLPHVIPCQVRYDWNLLAPGPHVVPPNRTEGSPQTQVLRRRPSVQERGQYFPETPRVLRGGPSHQSRFGRTRRDRESGGRDSRLGTKDPSSGSVLRPEHGTHPKSHRTSAGTTGGLAGSRLSVRRSGRGPEQESAHCGSSAGYVA